MEFEGKVCLVTGGASGIGKALVESFLKINCKCLFVDIQHRTGEQLCNAWKSEFGAENVEFMRVDVSSATNLERAFEKCFQVFGSLDIVVNNAGVDGEINWETQIKINFLGSIVGTQLAIKYMGKNYAGLQIGTGKGGVVLNLSSVQGLMSWPAMPVYSAGKAGIIQFTRCAGHQLEFASHGVKIVCLCPYGVDTGMNDFHPYVGMTKTGSDFLDSLNVRERILSTEEVAQAGLKIIDEGTSGSIWYLHKHGDRPFEVPLEFSSFEDLLKHQEPK